MSENIWLVINGTQVRVTEPQTIIPMILPTMNNLPYWSLESLKDLYVGTLRMVVDFCKFRREELTGSQRAKYTRTINRTENSLKFLPGQRERLLEKLYDMILSGEGYGRLTGYGMANKFGDKLKGNPEVDRMKTNHLL